MTEDLFRKITRNGRKLYDIYAKGTNVSSHRSFNTYRYIFRESTWQLIKTFSINDSFYVKRCFPGWKVFSTVIFYTRHIPLFRSSFLFFISNRIDTSIVGIFQNRNRLFSVAENLISSLLYSMMNYFFPDGTVENGKSRRVDTDFEEVGSWVMP